jgi:hypothetical protein
VRHYLNYLNRKGRRKILARRSISTSKHILTGKELQVFFDPIVAGEAVVRIPESISAVYFHSLYHKTDIVRSSILIKI